MLSGMRITEIAPTAIDQLHHSIYIHCESNAPFAPYEALIWRSGGLTHPAPGVLDFNDWRALQPIYDAAKVAGIFVVLRPGS